MEQRAHWFAQLVKLIAPSIPFPVFNPIFSPATNEKDLHVCIHDNNDGHFEFDVGYGGRR